MRKKRGQEAKAGTFKNKGTFMSQNSLILPTTGTVSGLQMAQDINYALDTLNTLNSGASAPGTVEAGMLWHDTTNNLIKLRNLANSAWIAVGSVDETNGVFVPAGSFTPSPQGRLTLTSNTPVMNADATAQTSVYYTPYNGSALSIYNGTEYVVNAFSQLTLALSTSNHPAGEVFDIYASVQSGSIVLSAMYWGSNASRSSSAGGKTGTGNATITQKNGLWVNNAAISSSDSFNGSTGYAIAQYQGTYLGTFYTTANGQTGITLQPSSGASGGNGNIIGLWNAYNRVRALANCRDSTSSWTYNATSWRPADNSTDNRISWVDGLAQSFVSMNYQQTLVGASGTVPQIGIGINSTTAPSDPTTQGPAGSNGSSVSSNLVSYPLLGFNYGQALESINTGSTSCTFFGSGYQALTAELEI